MSIGARDILTRHQQDTGPLKGKVLSNVTIRVPGRIDVVLYKPFAIPDKTGAFARFCREPIDLGFRKPQRLLPAAHSFIESGYRGLKDAAGALLIELFCRTGSELYLGIKATGVPDADKYGGRERQERFDSMAHHSRPEVSRVYRIRQYIMVGTIFKNVGELGGYLKSNHVRVLGSQTAARGNDGLAQQTTGQTRPVSRRLAEDWFSATMNHWLPRSFVEQLDEDALRLLFPPSLIDRLRGRKVQKGRLRLTPENRQKMIMKVKESPFFYPYSNDEQLVAAYEDAGGGDASYERGYAVSVKMVCDLAVEIRVVKGGSVLRAMVGTPV